MRNVQTKYASTPTLAVNCLRTKDRFARARGFSLMEVLIALLVLSLGLLGLAALQSIGFKFNQDSFERTQATLLAYDIIDRMRANSIARNDTANNFNNIPISAAATTYTVPADPYCATGCSPTEIRNQDLRRWKLRLQRMLAAGNGGICRGAFDNATSLNCTVDTSKSRYQVAVRWFEGEQENGSNTGTNAPQVIIIDVEI